MGWLNLGTTIGSYLIPKLATKTKYPGAASSPWLPGSNPVPRTTGPIMNTTDKWSTPAIAAPPTGASATDTVPNRANANQYDKYLKALEYGLPDVETMSWEEALTRARSMYEPQYKASILARDKMASDQRELLAQTLGARGYAGRGGGKMESGQGNITQNQAIDNAKTNAEYNSTLNQAAHSIYEGEAARGQAKMNAMLGQQNMRNASQMDMWNISQTRAMQKEKDDITDYNNAMAWLWKLFGMDGGE